jgi:hypothetical protein
MTIRPHDLTDLYLAPVALELDRRLERLTGKSIDEIVIWIALDTDRQPSSPEERPVLAIRALEHLLDTHGWELRFDHRGLRLSHGDHSLVLGIPDSLKAYLDA